MALFEDIQQRLQQFKTNQAGVSQPQVASTLQTKATGKLATGAPAPAISTEAVKGAESVANQQLKTQQLQGQLQGAQLAQQEQGLTQRLESAKQNLASQQRIATQQLAGQAQMAGATQQAQRDIFTGQQQANRAMLTERISNQYEQAVQNLLSDKNIEEANIFEQFRQSNAELSARKDAAELEQLAFIMAMRDKKYVEQLQQTWAVNNLRQEQQFKKEAQQLILGEELNSVIDSLEWQEKFNQSERDFTKEMANIDLQSALDIAKANMQAENTRAIISGVTDVTGTILTHGDKLKPKSDTAPTNESSGGDK